MMFKPVDHMEIAPKQAEGTIGFYVNIIDLKQRCL